VTAASIYALIPFGNSALGARLISGKEPPLGGIDYEYECYCLAHETLTDRAGWRAFSPVHYGDAHRESWVYSSARSGDMDVLGLGCGAGGMIEKLSYMNPMQLDDYLDDRDPTVVRREECSTNRQIIARMTEGDGIDRRTFCNAVAGAAAILESLSFLGLIHENDGRLTLTRDGSFWAYNIGRILAQHVEQAAIE
jgi:coproporphyrinogen III oxidase-like Fe-S oxidoreductase